MKAKVNIPARGKSNPPLKNLPPSSLLEEQTKKMEQRLKELKDVMAEQAVKRESFSTSSEKWVSASKTMPIKNYADTVLKFKDKESKEPLNTKTAKDNPKLILQKPASRERVSREKLPTVLPPITTPTPTSTSAIAGGTSQKNKENESQKDFFKAANNTASSITSLNSSATKIVVKPQRSRIQMEDEKVAENNIAKALSKQKETWKDLSCIETDEVERFLEEIGLPQYIQTFKENGFDDLETVMEIQTKHLVEMKIPAGHQIKLSKRIEQIRKNNKDPEKSIILPNERVETEPTFQINMDQIKSSSQRQNEYIQLEEPTKEQAIGDDKTGGGELLRGNFDEAESHKSFLEALNEWRNAKKVEPTEEIAAKKVEVKPRNPRAKKVRFEEPVKEKEKVNAENKESSGEVEYISSKPAAKKETKKEDKEQKEEKKLFFFSGDSTWNKVEFPGQKETSTDMSPREAQKLQKPRISCWNCYKLISDDTAKYLEDKHFCSDECIKTFKDSNSIQCNKKGCKNKFLKEKGVMSVGKWYCSEACKSSADQGSTSDQITQSTDKINLRNNESERIDSEENDEEEEDLGDMDIEFGLSVDITSKEILTLEQLEEKYKNINNIIEKHDDAEVNFEDSLN